MVRISSFFSDFADEELCLSFCNTVPNRRADQKTDKLQSFQDLVSWFRKRELISSKQAAKLENPGPKSTALLMRATELSEATYRLFAATSENKSSTLDDIAILNRSLAPALASVRMNASKKPFLLDYGETPESLNGPIAISAANLLASPDAGRVRTCDGATCTWLFIDRTKNKSKRWCEMSDCGNRAKQRRHYERIKKR